MFDTVTPEPGPLVPQPGKPPAPPATPAATPLATPARASLPRRVLRRGRRELVRLRRTTVRQAERPDLAPRQLRGERLRLVLPDAAGLARLASAGSLTGQVSGLDLHLASAPEWLVTGVRPPRFGRYLRTFEWRRRGSGLRVHLRWARPYDVNRALADLLRAVLRARPWDQASGPVYALDRTAWRAGAASWPQGWLATDPPTDGTDEQGRPLGAYQPVTATPARPDPGLPPVVTAVANPFGRTLTGAATRYRLAPDGGRVTLWDQAGRPVWHAAPAAGAEAAVARGGFDKYAVVTVETPPDAYTSALVRALAACGVVFAAPEPATRTRLDALGLVTVADPAQVDDLPGYALSVAAARTMAITGDAALRHTALAGPPGAGAGTSGAGTSGAGLPLPAVTAVVSTMRAEHLETLVGYLARQTYPALELVVGLHGYDLPGPARQRLCQRLPFPARIVAVGSDEPFGAVLGRLSRLADGDLLTKLDDDDHYGPNHVTDLMLAWHTSGADLVAKGARFVYFPERDETIDRAWAAPELFDVTPAGGTMLLSRGVLAQVGGWSHSSRHVDADLLTRIRSTGGLVYRTHALEYVYVRRSTGHTFVTGIDELLAHGERVYPGLPDCIIDPGGPAPGPARERILEGHA